MQMPLMPRGSRPRGPRASITGHLAVIAIPYGSKTKARIMTSQNEAIPGPVPEVPVDLDELTPSRVLLIRYMIESQLTAPGSMSGHQADRLRSGLGGRPPDGGRVNGQEALHAKLGDLLLLCRDLNRVEERCCRLRYGATAGSVTYEALRRVGDLREGDGEEVVEVRPRDIEGRSVGAEWVRVRGRRARLPSYLEISRLLAADGVCSADGGPMTSGAVERRLRDASAKIATAIRARLAMQQWEERAPG